MAAQRLIQALKAYDPGLFAKLHRTITPERVHAYLQPLADTPAPSQSTVWTRARALEQVLAHEGLLNHPHVRFERNYRKTGNSVLLVGRDESRKQIWLLAHLDIISYLVEPGGDGRYPLSPWCYHMMKPGRRRALAMGFDNEKCGYEVSAHGDIVVDTEGGVFFETEGGVVVRAGQRVVFDSQLTWDRASGLLRGSMDDAGAVAALAVAAAVLADYPVEVLLGLTDEEEGTGGPGNQTICRGGKRLLRFFEQPDLVIVSDVHEGAPMVEGHGPNDFRPGDGASFAEKSSRGKGSVTPPHLYELVRQLAGELAGEQIQLRENIGGYVSRSEDVNAVLRTPNICLLGFLGTDRHFDTAVPTANLNDLVNLAKAVVCLALLTQTPEWSELSGPA